MSSEVTIDNIKDCITSVGGWALSGRWMDDMDIMQEAFLALLESAKSYNPSRSDPTTWGLNYIKYRILSLKTKAKVQQQEVLSQEDEEGELTAFRDISVSPLSHEFCNIYSSLSKDAKACMKLIIKFSSEILSQKRRPSYVAKLAMREFGWSPKKCKKVMSELKKLCT